MLLLLKAMKWNIFGVRSARFWWLPGAVAFPQVSYASRASIQISKPFFYQPGKTVATEIRVARCLGALGMGSPLGPSGTVIEPSMCMHCHAVYDSKCTAWVDPFVCLCGKTAGCQGGPETSLGWQATLSAHVAPPSLACQCPCTCSSAGRWRRAWTSRAGRAWHMMAGSAVVGATGWDKRGG